MAHRSTSSLSKRAIDVAVSALALALTGPVAVLVAVAVRLVHGSPIVFRQMRAGMDDRPFSLMKFRTMSGTTQGSDTAESEASRITWLGRLLRRTSLDEIPQLVNVLKGEMSLVGPRPLPLRYLPRYLPQERRRHEVRPGLTGWAQVNGRNAIGWEQRFALDVWYVDHWSLGLDLRILARTLRDVVLMRDTGARTGSIMPEFRPEIRA